MTQDNTERFRPGPRSCEERQAVHAKHATLKFRVGEMIRLLRLINPSLDHETAEFAIHTIIPVALADSLKTPLTRSEIELNSTNEVTQND